MVDVFCEGDSRGSVKKKRGGTVSARGRIRRYFDGGNPDAPACSFSSILQDGVPGRS